MEHLRVLSYFVALLVGIWAVVLSFQSFSSVRHPVLRPFSWFLTTFNLLVLFSFTLLYSSTNLLSGYEELASSGIVQIAVPIVRITFFGMAFALVRFSLALRGKTLAPAVNRRLNAGAALLILILAFMSYLLMLTAGHDVAMWADVGVSLATYLFLVFLMVSLYRFGRRLQSGGERRMVTSISLFYLIAFCSIIVVALLPEKINAIPGAFILLLFNLIPVLWLRRHFQAPEMDTVSILDDPSLLDAFCEQHGISNREREIAELILHGKSNKEIEDRLFISLNTVKNHIYRLFRKLGVNSRSQFIHMLLQEHQNRYRNS